MKQGINSRRTGNLQRLAGNCPPCAGIRAEAQSDARPAPHGPRVDQSGRTPKPAREHSTGRASSKHSEISAAAQGKGVEAERHADDLVAWRARDGSDAGCWEPHLQIPHETEHRPIRSFAPVG
jgi:hypothetical protein